MMVQLVTEPKAGIWSPDSVRPDDGGSPAETKATGSHTMNKYSFVPTTLQSAHARYFRAQQAAKFYPEPRAVALVNKYRQAFLAVLNRYCSGQFVQP